MNDLLQVHKSVKEAQAGKKKLCQQCSIHDEDDDDAFEVGEAQFKCLDCSIDLCRRCKRNHSTVPLLKGHRILPLSQETELVVDRLIFCEFHDSETIKFYCKECNLPICITCKVTDHESHETQTVEKALSVFVPEIEKYVKILEERVSKYENRSKYLDGVLNDVETSYQKCCQDIEVRENEYIAIIKREAQKSKDQLLKQKNIETQKLSKEKEKIQNKKKEEVNLTNVTKTSLERARHATLLTELVQGKVAMKLKEHIEKKPEHVPLDLKMPNLLDYKEECAALLTGINLTPTYTLVNTVPININQTRFWPDGFEILSMINERVMKITLPDDCLCTRLAFIDGKIWAPLTRNDKIQIYNTNGELDQEINIKSPRNVLQFHNVVIVASMNGLYEVCIDKGCTRSSEVFFEGKFADLTVDQSTGDLLALEYYKQEVIAFSKNSGKWIEKEKYLPNFQGVSPGSNVKFMTMLSNSFNFDEHDFRYVIVNWVENIGLYSNKWKLTNVVNGDFRAPYLGGFDKECNMLFANRDGHNFQILNTINYAVKKLDSKVDLSGVLDIHMFDNCVWVLQHNEQIKQFEILKYVVP